ncbi:hypothetical protein BaRGS_00031521, partial [Batillaria attramentaria]
ARSIDSANSRSIGAEKQTIAGAASKTRRPRKTSQETDHAASKAQRSGFLLARTYIFGGVDTPQFAHTVKYLDLSPGTSCSAPLNQ